MQRGQGPLWGGVARISEAQTCMKKGRPALLLVTVSSLATEEDCRDSSNSPTHTDGC